jgi:2-methylcitrate dehydratase PrpD
MQYGNGEQMKLVSSDQGSESRQFAEFFAALSERDLPEQIFDRALDSLIDSVGCGLFGATQSWSQMIAANTLAESAPGRCTLLGRGEQLAPAPAALVNGTSMHGFELDDLISEAIAHPGTVVVPAALAVAEHANVSGLRLLLGIIAGYETLARVSVALGMETPHRGFHMTGVVGPVAAAVAAGVTLGFTPDKLLAAIGLACSASSGIRAFAGGSGGGMVKRLHAGRSAEAGVRMCQLAARGFTGPSAALDGKFGLLETFSGKSARPARLTENIGNSWAINEVWVKVYPICGGIQSTVELLQRLRGAAPLSVDEVKKVRIGVSSYAVRNNGDPIPLDTMAAQYSIPYCAAVALLGDPRDPDVFSENAIGSAATQTLIGKIELYADEKADATHPKQRGANVELHLASGETRKASIPEAHGTPSDPCTKAEIEAKFRQLARAAKSAVAIDRILAAARELRKLPSIEPLSQALRA